MLKAIVLELKLINEANLPLSHGRSAYAAALDLLGRLDSELEKRIHDPDHSKPITVSPVWEALREGACWKLRRSGIYRWRLTGLDKLVSDCLDRISPSLGNIRIGNAIFEIVCVHSDAHDDPDAGQATYAALLEQWRAANPPAVFPLQFCTPTTFRRGDFENPFPAPSLVFGSLLKAWNTYAPQTLGNMTAVLREMIILTKWKGETRRVELGSRRTVGFIGRFTYRVVENLPEIRRLLGMLVDYAFYAGVGWQTTHGLGQTRLAGRN